MNALERRIIELSYENKLTHISSCLNCVNLIADIYHKRSDHEPFLLGNGHASLAHYVVLESRGLCDAEEMITKHGVHSSRDMTNGIWCSNGSLGQAETVAVGFALADKERKVWLVTSDGACLEGSVYEAMRFASHNCPNLSIHVVFNGYGAYGAITLGDMPIDAEIYYVDQERYPKFLQGLQGHYIQISKEQFDELMA